MLSSFVMPKEQNTEGRKSEVLQGTLDLRVLKFSTRSGRSMAMASPDGSSKWRTGSALNEGTIYTWLLRLQQRKWIASEWGEKNR
jgi:PadR family transcriptional regulator PadR